MSDSFDRYQEFTRTTALYPQARQGTTAAINYCLMGLGGEVGEIQNKFKKVLRGDKELSPSALIKELGGALWYMARLADELGYKFHEVSYINEAELTSRKARGTLQGDGDNR